MNYHLPPREEHASQERLLYCRSSVNDDDDRKVKTFQPWPSLCVLQEREGGGVSGSQEADDQQVTCEALGEKVATTSESGDQECGVGRETEKAELVPLYL